MYDVMKETIVSVIDLDTNDVVERLSINKIVGRFATQEEAEAFIKLISNDEHKFIMEDRNVRINKRKELFNY